MSIIASWHDDKKNIGRLDFYGCWTLRELSDAREQLADMAGEVGHGISVIVNLSDAPVWPDEMIAHVVQTADLRSGLLDEFCYFVVVGSDPLGKALFKSFSRICRPNKLMGKVSFADSLDEALTILVRQIDAYTE